MATNFSTIGGVVTRGETYTKLLHHLQEARDMASTMAHLHNTEDGAQDRLVAKGWLGIAELIKRMEHQITQLAMRKLQ